MALEAVIQQLDPLMYGYNDYNNMSSSRLETGEQYGSFEEPNPNAEACSTDHHHHHQYWDSHSPPSSLPRPSASPPETCRPKRRRNKTTKNKEELENQRMTHIAVERNRRRQMNDYLALLRSLMPPSYVQRGDQASIVGGAINFVKELEQLIQSLEAHKLSDHEEQQKSNTIFSDFFDFPQFSMRPSTNSLTTVEVTRSSIAEIEATMVESHANIKVLTKKRPKQLLKMVAGFHSICLNILHLNITTVDQSVLYSFSVKVEDECQLTTVNEIATAVHEMVGMIQEENPCSQHNPPHEFN